VVGGKGIENGKQGLAFLQGSAGQHIHVIYTFFSYLKQALNITDIYLSQFGMHLY